MGSVPARVHLITLGVVDVARATGFYESLGWSRSAASQEDITFLNTGGVIVALYRADELAADALQPESAPEAGFRGVTLAINVASREAVDEAYAAWLAVGAGAIKPPQEVFWGGYSSYVADLDGHLWELAHNPYWAFADDGSLDLP